MRKAGTRLRINVQLISVADGYHLWSERYDRQLEDIFEIQEEIALAIVNALKIKLLGDERAVLRKRYTENAAAYDLYLKGRLWNRRTADGFKSAIGYFKQAIELDDDYAVAYSGLADYHLLLGFYEVLPPSVAGEKAKAFAKKPSRLMIRSPKRIRLTARRSAVLIGIGRLRVKNTKSPGDKSEYLAAYQYYAINLAAQGDLDGMLDKAHRCLELTRCCRSQTPISHGFIICATV